MRHFADARIMVRAGKPRLGCLSLPVGWLWGRVVQARWPYIVLASVFALAARFAVVPPVRAGGPVPPPLPSVPLVSAGGTVSQPLRNTLTAVAQPVTAPSVTQPLQPVATSTIANSSPSSTPVQSLLNASAQAGRVSQRVQTSKGSPVQQTTAAVPLVSTMQSAAQALPQSLQPLPRSLDAIPQALTGAVASGASSVTTAVQQSASSPDGAAGSLPRVLNPAPAAVTSQIIRTALPHTASNLPSPASAVAPPLTSTPLLPPNPPTRGSAEPATATATVSPTAPLVQGADAPQQADAKAPVSVPALIEASVPAQGIAVDGAPARPSLLAAMPAQSQPKLFTTGYRIGAAAAQPGTAPAGEPSQKEKQTGMLPPRPAPARSLPPPSKLRMRADAAITIPITTPSNTLQGEVGAARTGDPPRTTQAGLLDSRSTLLATRRQGEPHDAAQRSMAALQGPAPGAVVASAPERAASPPPLTATSINSLSHGGAPFVAWLGVIFLLCFGLCSPKSLIEKRRRRPLLALVPITPPG